MYQMLLLLLLYQMKVVVWGPDWMGTCLALASVLAHVAHPAVLPCTSTRPPMHTTRAARPLMQMDGGDLEGGKDSSRNADVMAIKKLFYAAPSDKGSGAGAPSDTGSDAGEALEAVDTARLGLLHDLPLTRWNMVLLPHQQTVLNVFQPEYVHLFESLLSTKRPWLYMHVLLPGGIDNLANPEYALPGLRDESSGGRAGAKVTLDGTLMQVVAVQRLPDARLALIVQGLRRAVIVRGTQRLPYARADVQALPDEEELLAAGRLCRRWFRPRAALVGGEEAASEEAAEEAGQGPGAEAPGPGAEGPGPGAEGQGPARRRLEDDEGQGPRGPGSRLEDDEGLRRRLVLAAATAADRCWQPYEFASVEFGRRLPPTLVRDRMTSPPPPMMATLASLMWTLGAWTLLTSPAPRVQADQPGADPHTEPQPSPSPSSHPLSLTNPSFTLTLSLHPDPNPNPDGTLNPTLEQASHPPSPFSSSKPSFPTKPHCPWQASLPLSEPYS